MLFQGIINLLSSAKLVTQKEPFFYCSMQENTKIKLKLTNCDSSWELYLRGSVVVALCQNKVVVSWREKDQNICGFQQVLEIYHLFFSIHWLPSEELVTPLLWCMGGSDINEMMLGSNKGLGHWFTDHI